MAEHEAEDVPSLKALVASYEQRLILDALAAVGGHQRRAAARLRVLPSTLSEKLKRHGIASGPGTVRVPEHDGRQPIVVWRGRLPRGSTLELAGLDGDVRVEASDGDEVRVLARRRGQPRPTAARGVSAAPAVHVQVLEHGLGLSVCAVRTRLEHHAGVELQAEVPRGIAVAARTTNGDIAVVGLSENVEATTTNGHVVFLPALLAPIGSGAGAGASRAWPPPVGPSARPLTVPSGRG